MLHSAAYDAFLVLSPILTGALFNHATSTSTITPDPITPDPITPGPITPAPIPRRSTRPLMIPCRFGRQICGDLDAASQREWLVADGLGGYAMGTVAGLRTRRYHGLLIVADNPLGRRHLGLAALDPVLIIGDRRVHLATHEWSGGVVDPTGHRHLASFALVDGVPRWRWSIGDVTLEMEIAATHGRAGVGVTYRLVRSPGAITLNIGALCTWRDAHGERFAGPAPNIDRLADGFVFEGHYRVQGPGFQPGGEWYRNAHYREEAERRLDDHEDLWHAGSFSAALLPGERTSVGAWAGDLTAPPPDPFDIVDAARSRARTLARLCRPHDDVDETLAVACDQFIVTPTAGGPPTVVAGYPWFGDWSRDTMTSYEGLFLETHRWDEGRALLRHAAESLSEGMLANTADTGSLEYNTADATLWFVNAVGRHVVVTGDLDLAAELAEALESIVEHHIEGTRFGIGVDLSDGLVTQGRPGIALTWMDARIDQSAVTPRIGKPVEINALWINALGTIDQLAALLGRNGDKHAPLQQLATASFQQRFVRDGGGLFDVVDGPTGDDRAVRPNQLLAASLPHGPVIDPTLVLACGPLLTSLGLRSLSPDDPAYRSHHRGGAVERDLAYHQGTVWPWLLGPYIAATAAVGINPSGLLDDLESHLGEYGLGSISETADAAPPHGATGCPFQAWSVAEIFRARRLLLRLVPAR